MMKLYFHPMSSNARRAAMVALETKAPVEMVFVDLQKGEQRAPSYAAMNPNTKVPTLDDNGFFLNESYAIMTYLADKMDARALYPTGAKERADVNRWLFWCANEWSPVIGKLNYENMLKATFGQGAPDAARVAEYNGALTRLAGILNDHLKTHAYVCGQDFTLADIALAASLMSTVPAKLPVLDFDALQAWFKRVQARDSWQKTEPKF